MKFILGILALAVSLVCPGATAASSEPVVPPGEMVAGQSQADWSRAWAQWAGSFDKGASPIGDTTGESCAARQRGPVWFLAGTSGTRRVVRTCKVPRDKYLFLPLLNYVATPNPGTDSTCAAVQLTAAALTEDPEALILDVDGAAVENLAAHRQATATCFDMGVLTESKLTIYPSAANGYYVMLKPLSPGRHVLNFGGFVPNLLQAVTYTLVVE